MFRIPAPPEPPTDSQQWLEQLASYYQQLVDYHHQAAQTAARQLAHLEILLGDTTEHEKQTIIKSATIPLERNQTIIDSPAIAQLSSSMPVVDRQDLMNPQLSLLSPPNTPTELTEGISRLLATEKGHAVHIDYIVRKLYGILNGDNLSSITAWVRMVLKSGEADSKWSSIPDSPECWTLNLQELTTSSNREPLEKTTLTTREVAQLLQTSPKVIIRTKSKSAEKFQEGTHYLVDEQNWYYWTQKGIDLFKSLLEKTNPPSPPSKRLSKIDKPQRLPPYHEFNLMDSIKKLLEERMGQVLSIDEVCQTLYGELPPSQYTRIRAQVGKYLSKGKLKGDWVAVPDQKSHYTWDLNKIKDNRE